jgi:c-di-GMP-binding flagellar brake protein YcgR
MNKETITERRKHDRLLLSLPMQIQWVNDEGRIFNESSKSVNISLGGVYFKSREKLPIGKDAMVTFDLPFYSISNLGVLKTRGEVVRIEETKTDEGGIALKFLEELKFSTVY